MKKCTKCKTKYEDIPTNFYVSNEPTIVLDNQILNDIEQKVIVEHTEYDKLPAKSEESIFNFNNKEKLYGGDTMPEKLSGSNASTTSDAFIIFNTKNMINELMNNFALWEKTGTSEGILYISNIKDILDKYRERLKIKSCNRILISSLDLIFENNIWEDLPEGQMDFLRKELDRFRDGVIESSELNKFTKQLYRSKISLLKNYESKEEDKNQEESAQNAKLNMKI